MKKLTVVVPCYNVEDYLCRCLDSLVHQDIPESDYEVIAVDDGSTDSTGEICDRYAKEYPQVKVMHQTNAGVSVARNNGMSIAQGQYLFFVDGDDFVAENCFKVLLHIAETNALDVVMFDFKAVNPDTPVPTAQSSEAQDVKVITGKEFLTDNCLHGAVWLYFVKRELVERERLHFPVDRMCDDNVFSLSAILAAHRMIKLSKVCYYYVQRPGSIIHEKGTAHKLKYMGDIIYCSKQFGEVIEKYRGELSEPTYSRLIGRRNSFLYVAIVGALRAGVISEVCSQLKADGLLPLGKLDQRDFTDTRWTAIRLLSRCPMMLCAVGKLMSWLK